MFSYRCLSLLLLFCLPIYAQPLLVRQAPGLPVTFTTATTAAYPSGTSVLSCVITLTPVTDKFGNGVYREVKVCTFVMTPAGDVSPGNVTTSSSVSPSPTSSSISSQSTSLDVPPSPSASDSTLGGTSPPSLTDIISSSITTSSSTTTSISTETSLLDSTPSIPPPLPSSTSSVPPSASAVSAASSTLPGKKLSVLPIGLGVFAGISVIALIVIGLVTYERTKYRRAFRQRKLAEEAAPMGYGGTRY